MSHKLEPILILGKPKAPKDSWWTRKDLPRQLTAYVEREHLARMRASREGLIVIGLPREQAERKL